MARTVTKERVEDFKKQLQSSQVNAATIEKYATDIGKLAEYLNGSEVTQEGLDAFKVWLIEEKKFKKSSANAYIASVRIFFNVMHWDGLDITAFALDYYGKKDKYISKADYQRLLTTAMYLKDYRMAMLIQTLCHMDVRYSELKHLTVDAVKKGYLEITRRQHVLHMEIPEYLRESLSVYIQQTGIVSGFVFRTSAGSILDRSNAWRLIKQLAIKAGLDEEKVMLSKLKMPGVQDYYPFYPMPEEPGSVAVML